MSETIILIIAAFTTSMISAVIGMGGGITLLGIMALLIPEGYMVVALHGVIQLVSNMTRTTIFRCPHLSTDYTAVYSGNYFRLNIIYGDSHGTHSGIQCRIC